MNLRPHFAVCFEKCGICQLAQNGLIWKFFSFYLHKFRIKRWPVFEKNCHLMYLGPYNAGRFLTNEVVGQSAQIGPILAFDNIFLYKIKIQRGYFLWKKLPSHVIRTPCGRLFWSNACLLTGQLWAYQIFESLWNKNIK